MTEWRIEWAARALEDLDAIVDYIATEPPRHAAQVPERLLGRAEALGQFPERGREIPELLTVGEGDYRELIEAPWRIVYRLLDGFVLVAAVVDSRRDMEASLIERFGLAHLG